MMIKAVFLALAILVPAMALGNECVDDGDCPVGMVCDEVMVPCPTCTPCTCPPCDPLDEECESCECRECPSCDPEVATYCRVEESSCTEDADCIDGFICQAVESCSASSCACGGCVCPECAPGEECPPCECDEEPVCECEDEEPVCEVEGSYCIPEPLECTDDNQCPEDWECVIVSTGMGCACADCACEVEPCPPGEECPEPECDCPPCDCPDEEEFEEGYCAPSGWREIYEQYGADVAAGMESWGSGAPQGGGAVMEDPLSPEPGSSKDGDDEVEENDETGGENQDGSVGVAAGADADEDSGGSCSLSGSAGDWSSLGLLLLGAALALFRRRQ